LRTNPRQHILETWRAFAKVSIRNGEWVWGGRDESNSVSDAEQLLTLLYPATEIGGFTLSRPDATADDVLAVLRPFGEGREIAMHVLSVTGQYLDRYTTPDGRPIFSGGSYVRPSLPDQPVEEELREIGITESYSISVTLCLAAKGFLKEFQQSVERQELRAQIDAVNRRIDGRLSAAMVGLLRAFVINVVAPDSEADEVLRKTVSRNRVAGQALMQSFTNQLQPIRDKLPELTFGLSKDTERTLRDFPDRLFECGWTWSDAVDATEVTIGDGAEVDQSRKAIAESRPSLHFTMNALDGLLDLFSRRTSRQGLLNPEQQSLREALQLRWGLALQYWATLATFGSKPWPVEDIPWQTTDGTRSAYYTELVLAIIALDQTFTVGQPSAEVLTRAAAVLEELAQRGRVNRRALYEDRGITLHDPGVPVPLRGSEKEGGPPLVWIYRGYAPTLAKTALRIAKLSTNRRTRSRLIEVADETVEHILARRTPGGLWDNPSAVFPGVDTLPTEPSWDLTERAMEFFVAAADVVVGEPVADPLQIDQARSKIAEAEHILDQEQLTAPTAGGSRVNELLDRAERQLNRASALVAERPSTAGAIADAVLRDLDELATARLDAARSS
jgi:hypothetical protein